ncbi:MAG: hypothetical protein OXI59_03195, partial [Gemmatimonadota bacterium]|nr:hypothetical protein [Gemmatimonadota bacterium]
GLGEGPAAGGWALGCVGGGWERWADRVRFEVVPCLCPWSYVHNARLNAQEVDVNWAFLRDDVPEIKILKGFLEGRVFAGVIDLHEDWESPGFYLYEMFGVRESLGRERVVRVAQVCPINENAEVAGEVAGERVAVNGVIHPNMEVSRRKYGEGIPIALYQRGHTGHLVTSESPTAQPTDVRVAALLAAVEVLVET